MEYRFVGNEVRFGASFPRLVEWLGPDGVKSRYCVCMRHIYDFAFFLAVSVPILNSAKGVDRLPKFLTPAGFSFVGDWSCEGAFPANGKAHRATYHGEQRDDDPWIELTEVDVEPKGYIGHYSLGRSKADGKIVFLDRNSAGYALFVSDGWIDQMLTLTSIEIHYSAQIARNRFIYTIKDATHFDVEWQIDAGEKWRSGDLLHCTHRHSTL